jgi:formylglycine-generating enzyme required for sulfatase activity
MTWEQAKKYCQWRGGDLPTEAQWEKAARGTDKRNFPWGNQFKGTEANFCDQKNCELELQQNNAYDDGYADTAPVDAFPQGASPYGDLNMAGNVWEWVNDWLDHTKQSDPWYYEISPINNPAVPATGDVHVIRGRGWSSSWYGDVWGDLITWDRMQYSFPMMRYSAIGMRCATQP